MHLAQIDFEKVKIPQGENVPFQLDSTLTLGTIINSLLPYLFAIAGILLLLYLLWGGFHLMISRGDPKGIQEAKAKITFALIGFIIIFVAYWLVQVAGVTLGLTGITNIFQ